MSEKEKKLLEEIGAMMDAKLGVLTASIQGRKDLVDLKFKVLEKQLKILEKVLETKGGKLTEKIVMGGVGAILLYFLGALLGMFSIPIVNAGVMKAVSLVNNYINIS